MTEEEVKQSITNIHLTSNKLEGLLLDMLKDSHNADIMFMAGRAMGELLNNVNILHTSIREHLQIH